MPERQELFTGVGWPLLDFALGLRSVTECGNWFAVYFWLTVAESWKSMISFDWMWQKIENSYKILKVYIKAKSIYLKKVDLKLES